MGHFGVLISWMLSRGIYHKCVPGFILLDLVVPHNFVPGSRAPPPASVGAPRWVGMGCGVNFRY